MKKIPDEKSFFSFYGVVISAAIRLHGYNEYA